LRGTPFSYLQDPRWREMENQAQQEMEDYVIIRKSLILVVVLVIFTALSFRIFRRKKDVKNSTFLLLLFVIKKLNKFIKRSTYFL
jgi:uncharacterized membrane protein YhaH (DUF805 family)